MNKCPQCNQELEQAEYLEGERGFESAEVCMNEDCNNHHYTEGNRMNNGRATYEQNRV